MPSIFHSIGGREREIHPRFADRPRRQTPRSLDKGAKYVVAFDERGVSTLSRTATPTPGACACADPTF
jgi:xylan 1,4-beta-xylosidase